MDLKKLTQKDSLMLLGISIVSLFTIYFISGYQRYVNMILIILLIVLLSFVWSVDNKLGDIYIRK